MPTSGTPASAGASTLPLYAGKQELLYMVPPLDVAYVKFKPEGKFGAFDVSSVVAPGTTGSVIALVEVSGDTTTVEIDRGFSVTDLTEGVNVTVIPVTEASPSLIGEMNF